MKPPFFSDPAERRMHDQACDCGLSLCSVRSSQVQPVAVRLAPVALLNRDLVSLRTEDDVSGVGCSRPATSSEAKNQPWQRSCARRQRRLPVFTSSMPSPVAALSKCGFVTWRACAQLDSSNAHRACPAQLLFGGRARLGPGSLGWRAFARSPARWRLRGRALLGRDAGAAAEAGRAPPCHKWLQRQRWQPSRLS